MGTRYHTRKAGASAHGRVPVENRQPTGQCHTHRKHRHRRTQLPELEDAGRHERKLLAYRQHRFGTTEQNLHRQEGGPRLHFPHSVGFLQRGCEQFPLHQHQESHHQSCLPFLRWKPEWRRPCERQFCHQHQQDFGCRLQTGLQLCPRLLFQPASQPVRCHPVRLLSGRQVQHARLHKLQPPEERRKRRTCRGQLHHRTLEIPAEIRHQGHSRQPVLHMEQK